MHSCPCHGMRRKDQQRSRFLLFPSPRLRCYAAVWAHCFVKTLAESQGAASSDDFYLVGQSWPRGDWSSEVTGASHKRKMVHWSFSKWRWRAHVPFSVSPPPSKHGLTHLSIGEFKHSEDRARTRDLDCATHKRGWSCSAEGTPVRRKGTTHQAENHTCARKGHTLKPELFHSEVLRTVQASSLLFSVLFWASLGLSRPAKNDKKEALKFVRQKRP